MQGTEQAQLLKNYIFFAPFCSTQVGIKLHDSGSMADTSPAEDFALPVGMPEDIWKHLHL
jgi:hypothetical protein